TRIVGKRLRYTIEMFVDCFGPALRATLHPAIVEMQQLLGEVHDHFNAAQLYAALGAKLDVFLPRDGSRYQPVIDRLKAEHERQLQEGCQRFQLWWEGWQKPEIQIAIADLLSGAQAAWHVLPETENAMVAATPRSDLQTTTSLNAK